MNFNTLYQTVKARANLNWVIGIVGVGMVGGMLWRHLPHQAEVSTTNVNGWTQTAVTQPVSSVSSIASLQRQMQTLQQRMTRLEQLVKLPPCQVLGTRLLNGVWVADLQLGQTLVTAHAGDTVGGWQVQSINQAGASIH